MKSDNWLKYLANDWSLLGITTLNSGQPYSIYDYSGSVGGEYFGGNIELANPIVPIKPGLRPKSVETEHSGAYTYASAQWQRWRNSELCAGAERGRLLHSTD